MNFFSLDYFERYQFKRNFFVGIKGHFLNWAIYRDDSLAI